MEEENRQKRLTNKYLYERQMNMLKTLREHGAISEQQYLFSTEELTRKMKPAIRDLTEGEEN